MLENLFRMLFRRSSEQILIELKSSPIFDDSFPKRIVISHREYAALPEEEKESPADLHLAAAASKELKNRGTDQLELEFDIHKLGDRGYKPAIPTFARIWQQCAVSPIRVAAADALLKFDSNAALDPLADSIDQYQHRYMFCDCFPIEAIFKRDPQKAFDQLQGYFEPTSLTAPGGYAVPLATLEHLEKRGNPERWPQVDTQFPDECWFELVAPFHNHPVLGWASRRVLKWVDQSKLSRWSQSNVHDVRPSKLTCDFVTRYKDGDFEEVWRELREIPVLSEDLYEQAITVARMTMKRAKKNLELLEERLSGLGWRVSPKYPMLCELDDKGKSVISAIESHQLKIPPTLFAFWEVIGAVNFVWDTELSQPAPILCADVKKTFPELDPLCVDPPFEYMLDQIEEWKEENEVLHPIVQQPYLLDLSADSSIKRGFSGPGPYGILLPFDGADPEFRMSNRKLPFVEYLREAVWMGGFPDLRKFKANPSVIELLDTLTDGFIEF